MLTHRYVGVVMGLLMLLWFASGVVMLFVHWPEVTDEERAAGLRPIAWDGCCVFGETVDAQEVKAAVIESLAGRPVLRADGQVLDLTTGRPVEEVPQADARAMALDHARSTGVVGRIAGIERIARDQWTVTGYFNAGRPFWKVRLDDPAATDIYVSARTGEVAQVTDRPTRMLNWLGPIPHWLYMETLRQDVKLWTRVVVWTSIVGLFLTLTGLYLGVVAWRPWRDERLTPFKGLMAWHHLGGLAAGLLTLTWTASGLFSMNPWGFLEGGPESASERVIGAVNFGDLRSAIAAAKAQDVQVRQLRLAPFEGRVYLMADGARFDAAGRPAPLAPAALSAAARRLGPVASETTIRAGDAYYFGHHEDVVLPAYRVTLTDGVRYYLDPGSGQVLAYLDAPRRGFRWLHLGLHRLDFVPGLDRGAGWAAAMTSLLVFAGLGVATGVWLGWRRIKTDLQSAFRRSRRPL